MSPALLQDAWRALRRPGLQGLAQIGLALALAASLLVACLAHALATPDPAIPDPERVVLLDFMGNPPGHRSNWFTAAPLFFGPALRRMGVPLEHLARSTESALSLRSAGGQVRALKLLLADPELVPLFGMRALHGDLITTLGRRDALVLDTDAVRQLWGDLPPAQALGRSLPTVDGSAFVVGAVMAPLDPRNPLHGAPLLAGFDSRANGMSDEARERPFVINGRVFARLGVGARAEQVAGWMRSAFLAHPGLKQFPPEWTRGREAAFFRGLPLTQLPWAGEKHALRWERVGALAAAAALLTLLATLNGAQLSAAALLRRQRETAVRRSLGASRMALLRLWAAEALGPALLAAAAALLLAWWSTPWLAGWLGLWMPDFPPAALIAALFGLSLLLLIPQLALAAGWALRQPPAAALQGRSRGEGPWGRRLRQGLLGLQLGGALLLLALSGVLLQQHQHLLQADRGYTAEHRLVLEGLADGPPPVALIEALTHLPQVRSWSWGDALPTDIYMESLEGLRGPAGEVQLRTNEVAPSFFRTWGMKLLAGDPQGGGQGEGRVVLDAQAARILGFASPAAAVGQLLRGGGGFAQVGEQAFRIVAVTADLRFEAGRLPSQPKLFHLKEEPVGLLTLHGDDSQALEKAVHQTWQRLAPERVQRVELASVQRAQAAAEERRLTGLLFGVALLALAVAALGAQALVADTLRRRRREIVLRRLHGAGPAAIVRTLLGELLPPLGAALMLALPLAAWLGAHYLQQYADRVALLPGLTPPLLAAGALILPLLLLTLWQQLREALALQPIEALTD